MNLRDLQYFVAVAQCQHIGKAAEMCHVSQPTLSMQLKKLEDFLGVTLFERSNKQVMITHEGRILLERAQRIVDDAKALREAARALHHPLAGTLKIGLFPTLAPYLLPHIMPAMHAQLPDIRWELTEEKSNVLLEKLHKGELDAALLALPLRDDALHIKPLFQDTLCVAVAHTHPLASQSHITLDALQQESLLLLEEGHCLRAQMLDVCHLLQQSQHPEFQATSLETLRHMVALGEGVTLMPSIAKRDHDGIHYLSLEHDSIARTICMVWRKTSARTHAIEALANVIVQCYSA
jgi:LysR family hydrogen peroxide-inducible transcriptional activator